MMKPSVMGGLLGVFVLGLTFTVPLGATAEGITDAQADAILKELKQIRQLLQQQQTLLRQNTTRRAAPANQNVTLKLVDTYALGNKDAPVTLVEFTDYQCPYCSRFHTTTFPQLKKNFIDTGKVRFIARDLPLGFHKNAFHAARAARCAGEQDKYWELRHVLSSNPKKLSKAAIAQYAKDQRLDMPRFQACFESEKYSKEIKQDMADARSVGITGTPGFVLGRTSKSGVKGIFEEIQRVFEGTKISGAQPYAVFAAKINNLLVNDKRQAPTSAKTK